MMETTLRVACGQFQLQPDLDTNLGNIDRFLSQAAEDKVDLIVFPECALTGYPPRDRQTLDYVDQDKTATALEHLCRRACELKLAMAIGLAWREQDRWRNRACFIDETGGILALHDKIQQTAHERKFFEDGRRVESFTWRDIRVGMLICAEMRYPELWRLLRKDGVALMLHLASAFGSAEWKVPVLDGTMRCRAAENGYYVVTCNNAGPVPMMVSGVYNPDGLVLAKANYAVEEMIVHDITVGPPRGSVDFKDEVYRLERARSD